MPRWKDGSRGMLTVNALFAGFAGVLLINLAVHELDGGSRFAYGSMVLAGVALWAFAFAAERITDALDEGDPSTYVKSMLLYNIGVILIAGSITLFMWKQLVLWKHSGAWSLLIMLAAVYPWFTDLCYLCTPKKREQYLQLIKQSDEPVAPT